MGTALTSSPTVNGSAEVGAESLVQTLPYPLPGLVYGLTADSQTVASLRVAEAFGEQLDDDQPLVVRELRTDGLVQPGDHLRGKLRPAWVRLVVELGCSRRRTAWMPPLISGLSRLAAVVPPQQIGVTDLRYGDLPARRVLLVQPHC